MRRLPKTAALVILPLAGGIGLVVYLLAGISLRVSFGAALGLGGLMMAIAWKRFLPAERRRASRRAIYGLIGGLIGTACYDSLRYVLVKGLHYKNWPFDVFVLFGRLLAGPSAGLRTLWVIGTLFHIGCGMGFGMAYTLAWERPGIGSGLLWAAVLELFMITLYPGWLGLKALNELLTTSILGHAAYGAALGIVCAKLTQRESVV